MDVASSEVLVALSCERSILRPFDMCLAASGIVDILPSSVRLSWKQVGCFFSHFWQSILFSQSFELWPDLRQPKHSLLSRTNFTRSETVPSMN